MTRSIRIEAPGWLDDVADPSLGPDAPDEKRMAWLLDVLDRQVDEKTGGPFAAAVFSGLTGEVLGVGVNRVEPTSTCVAHAEVLALALAGQAVGSFSLESHGAVLLASTEPCAMCLGAVGWSGIARLVCAAGDQDARAIGFDEGDKPADWQSALARRGVIVATGVLRARAAAAMERYRDTGGLIYNG
ncbi:MAG TPA: nucleoside deaminase [Acidimicrobiales bacterium]